MIPDPMTRAAHTIAEHLGLDPARGWESTVRTLDRRTAERHVAEIRFTRRGTEERRVIAKLYSDETGRATFETMKAVEAGLACRPSPSLAVPAAVLYDAESRLLVQEVAQGIPYVALIEDPSFVDHLARAGRALATLHSLETGAAPVKGFREHIAEIVRPHPLELATAYPAYRELIEGRLAQMRACDAGWQLTSAAPIHRDFHLRQLFAGDDRTWLVDWDHFCLGDPAFDVGYFTTYLSNHLEPRLADLGTQAFLEAYSELRPDDFRDRLPVYASFNYLRRACRRFRLRDAGWEAELERMMQQLAGCADG